jgi:hypothetical protein
VNVNLKVCESWPRDETFAMDIDLDYGFGPMNIRAGETKRRVSDTLYRTLLKIDPLGYKEMLLSEADVLEETQFSLA